MNIKMTFEEFLKKYEGEKVSFVSYYKYRFTYRAIIGDKKITVELGDSDGDIYRSQFELVEGINRNELLYFAVTAI